MTRSQKAVASLPTTKSECSIGGKGTVFVGNNGWSLLHASVPTPQEELLWFAIHQLPMFLVHS